MFLRRIGDRYNLRKRLLRGDAASGVPELWLADDAGDVYYVKLWKRVGDERADIKALWNREVRALMRLQGYPGAAELFVRLYDLHAGEDSYYAVLDGGRRGLLSEILSTRGKYPWLTNLSEVSRRRPLWEGVLRLAEGMSVLHKEGTLHRALSSDAVFAGPDGQGDLRLSGFEWSLRIASRDGASPKVLHRYAVRALELEGKNAEYSTSTDWFDFGVLTAEIFGAPVRQLRRRDGLRKAVQNLSALREGERAFILDLLAEDDRDRLADSEYVVQGLRQIIRELSTVTAGAGRRLLLAVRLSPELELSRIIEVASERKAPATDPLLQSKWIEKDLLGDVRVVARHIPHPHFVVRGKRLEYRVMQWSVAGLTTWDIGFCQGVERAPRALLGDQYYSLGQRRLEVQTYSNVRRTIQTARDRSAPWNQVFPFTRSRHQMDKSLQLVHDFFRITQQLDTLFTIE